MKNYLQVQCGLLRPFLKRVAVAALAAFCALSAADAVDAIVVYSESTVYNEATTSGGEIDKRRDRKRSYLLFNTVTKRYQRITVDRKRKTFSYETPATDFSQIIDTETNTGRKEQTFSFQGPGNSWLYSNSTIVKFSLHDTARGRVQPKRYRTDVGLLLFDAVNVFRGSTSFEIARHGTSRRTVTGRSTFRVSNRLTSLVNKLEGGNTLMYAEAIVVTYLLERGFTELAA